MIIGESAAAEITSRGKKRYTKMVMATEHVPAITFGQTDLEGVNYASDNALIVILNINGNEVKWMIIDTSSSTNLLYYDAFKQMNIPEEKLFHIRGPIKRIIGASAYPFAKVLLPIKFGKNPIMWNQWSNS